MGTEKDSVVEVFDSLASEKAWEDLYSGRIDRHSYNFVTRQRAVEELLAPQAFRRVLDLGCGTGDLVEFLVSKGAQYTGLDMSPRMIERAYRTHEPQVRSGHAHFMVGDSERLPCRENEFDVVSAVGLIEYFPDSRRTLSEIGRVLKPGGLVLITVPHKSCINFTIRNILAPVRRLLSPLYSKLTTSALSVMQDVKHYHYDPVELDSLMRNGGFEKDSGRFSNFYLIPHPLDHVVPRLYMKLSEWIDRSSRSDHFGLLAANYIALYRRT
jgi:ubiquinone/menaquinone biosynthesis C-methylase UbiE